MINLRYPAVVTAFALFISGLAQAEDQLSPTETVAAIQAMGKEQVRTQAKVCFIEVRTMLLGYASGQRGVPAEHFVSKGAVTAGSHHHQLLLRGYKMEAADDVAAAKQFDECIANSG